MDLADRCGELRATLRPTIRLRMRMTQASSADGEYRVSFDKLTHATATTANSHVRSALALSERLEDIVVRFSEERAWGPSE